MKSNTYEWVDVFGPVQRQTSIFNVSASTKGLRIQLFEYAKLKDIAENVSPKHVLAMDINLPSMSFSHSVELAAKRKHNVPFVFENVAGNKMHGQLEKPLAYELDPWWTLNLWVDRAQQQTFSLRWNEILWIAKLFKMVLEVGDQPRAIP